jgi:hypothetical protein
MPDGHSRGVIEGAASILVAIVAFFLLPNWPHNTKWLTEQERVTLEMVLPACQMAIRVGLSFLLYQEEVTANSK